MAHKGPADLIDYIGLLPLSLLPIAYYLLPIAYAKPMPGWMHSAWPGCIRSCLDAFDKVLNVSRSGLIALDQGAKCDKARNRQ